jgi:hypothetical protein
MLMGVGGRAIMGLATTEYAAFVLFYHNPLLPPQSHPLLSRRAGANFIRVLPMILLAPSLVPVGDVVWPGFARMALLPSVEARGF